MPTALPALLLMLASPAHAHREDVSYLLAVSEGPTLTVAVELSWMDLIEPGAPPPETEVALRALAPRADRLVREGIALETPSRHLELPPPARVGVAERAGGRFVQLQYELPDPPGELGLDVHLFDALGTRHKTVARVERGGRSTYAVFDVEAPRYRFAGLAPPGWPIGLWLAGTLLALASAVGALGIRRAQ